MNDISAILDSAAGSLGKLSLNALLYSFCTLVICLVFKKLFLKLLSRGLSRTKLETRLSSLIQKGANALLWCVIVLAVGDSLGINLSSLLALFSVLGLAFSLAIQGSLSNLASGITILTNRPFKVGDYIEASGREGTVWAVGIFYTQLQTADNKIIYLPNSLISSGQVTNYSAMPRRRLEVNIQASYDDSCQKVIDTMLKTAQSDPLVLSDPAPMAFLASCGDSGINYTLRAWARSSDFFTASTRMTQAVYEAFLRENITVPYNRLEVTLKNNVQ